MAETKKIKTALVSVFHKDGLDELLAKLNEEGVKFLSTGGTQKFIESLGYECEKVEEVTTYPSILGGRVKTLHPKIFGAFFLSLPAPFVLPASWLLFSFFHPHRLQKRKPNT